MRLWYQEQIESATADPTTFARMSKGSKSRPLGSRAWTISEPMARPAVQVRRVRWMRRRREDSKIQ